MLALQSPTSICETLGARGRALRLARNFSQTELARMTGVSLSSIRRFEAAGQGALDLVVRIALALQATQGLEALFDAPMQSIAQVEALAQGQQRRRARKPRAQHDTAAG
jgi:transcriptional regulator with XRE-family HTH domain